MDDRESKTRHNSHRKLLPATLPILLGLLLAFLIVQAAGVNAATQRQEPFPPIQPSAVEAITDLMVRTTVDKEQVRPGEQLVYTLLYTNTTADQTISNVAILDTVSAGQRFDGSYQSAPLIPSEQYTYTGTPDSGYQLRWDLPQLNPGDSGEITLHTEVLTTTEPNIDDPVILLGNAVEIDTTQSGVTTNADDAVAMVIGPLLTLEKVDGPDPVLPGHRLVYTLTLMNHLRIDSIAATNVIITDLLPANTIFEAATSGGTYDPQNYAVVWHRPGSLLPGDSDTVTFSVLVEPDTASGSRIRNLKNNYQVDADEILSGSLGGKRDVSTLVDDTLQKSPLAKRMSGELAIVYPGDEVTYTLTVYNPLNAPLTGVLVTDTLPGDPKPFVYLRPANGSLPPEDILYEGRSLTWHIDLPAWGSDSRSFAVQVPRHTYIPPNRTYLNYSNMLAAGHPQASFTTEKNLASVRVEAPLLLSKVVSANHGLPGETVVYTITLENRGPYLVSSIRLTDTMGTFFGFIDMTQGPDPLPEYRTNPVVWTGLEVPPGEEVQIAFAARIDGYWLTKYNNNLDAASPDVFIPSRRNLTPVKIDPPLGINKTVDPIESFVNTDIVYAIDVTNLSTTTWDLAQLKDYLPTGWYQVGTNTNPAVITIDPPYSIPPGGTWSDDLSVHIGLDVNCFDLPKTYKNDIGDIEVHVTSPADLYAYNAVALAPLLLKPNVQVDLIPYRQTVQPGTQVTYTLHLNNVSPAAVSGASFEITLPPELVYQGSVSGPAPVANGSTLSWSGIDIAPFGELFIRFLVEVPLGTGYGTKTSGWTASAPGVCLGKLGTGDDPFGEGKLVVAEDVILLTKKALTDWVPPQTLVDFELKIKNEDAYLFVLPVVTDTMPLGFTYFEMISGPEPDEVLENQIIWRNVEVPGDKTVTWKVRMVASSLYGNYINKLAAYSTETRIKEADSNSLAVRPLFDLDKTASQIYIPQGGYFVYTITMVNQGETAFSDIRITDTLPTGFEYIKMMAGPPPVQLGSDGGQPVWSGLAVCAKGCIEELAFQVQVGWSVPLGVYYNTVDGFSPSGSIPGPITTAPVTVTEGTGPPPGGDEWIFLPVIFR